MKLEGRLFTGILALALIAVGAVAPLYIADKWRDIETSGTSAVEISSLFRNGTAGSTVEAFEQFNLSTDVLTENPFNTASSGVLCLYYKNAYSGSTTSPGYSTWAIPDAIGYQDIYTWPAPMYSSSINRICFNYHFSALAGLEDEASSIRLNMNVKNGENLVTWYYTSIYFGYAADDTGLNAPPLMSYNYGPDLTPSSSPGEKTHWINLSSSELNSIASFQNGRPDNRKFMQIIVTFPSSSGMTPTIYFSFETYTSYFEPSEGFNDIYTNETVYVGSDVSVSYLDIQTWILGASGVGIAITALAISPFWNPITDYFSGPGNGILNRKGSRSRIRGRRRSRGSGRRSRR